MRSLVRLLAGCDSGARGMYILFSYRPRTDDEVINFTLINFVLHVVGPMHERTLCTLLLVSGSA